MTHVTIQKLERQLTILQEEAKSWRNEWTNKQSILEAKVQTIQQEKIDLDKKLALCTTSVERQVADKQMELHRRLSRLDQEHEERSCFMWFGKYKNHCVASIWCVDKRYVRWIAGYSGRLSNDKKPETYPLAGSRSSLCPEAVMEARKMIKGHCLVCFVGIGPSWHTHCSDCYKHLLFE